MTDKVLEVKNLKISFRTPDGTVKAVRDVSFDLYRGETLAIVGESGSGKSVTSRAVLGILAGNALKEGGEILYDGRDLMKVKEEEFHTIRGDKIAMIFQDPLSSLNPIMRVGRQMTEAMLIKGKISQRESRKAFNRTLARLNRRMDEATEEREKEENKRLLTAFNVFETRHLSLENAYNRAFEAAKDGISEIDNLLFEIEKNAVGNVYTEAAEIVRLARRSIERFVVHERAEELRTELSVLRSLTRKPVRTRLKEFASRLFNRSAQTENTVNFAAVKKSLEKVKEILSEAVSAEKPDFFSMGYWLTFTGKELPDLSRKEQNELMRKTLYEEFLNEFLARAQKGVEYSYRRSSQNKRAAVSLIEELLPAFENEMPKKRRAMELAAQLSAAVNRAVDKLEVKKDNVAYTFQSSLNSALRLYFEGEKRNAKEEKRFLRQTAAYEKKSARGKKVGRVAEKNLVDLNEAAKGVVTLILRIKKRLEERLQETPDFETRTQELIKFLREKASGVAYKVTRYMAKNRALKLMEEVGIPEPRKRYQQYPFEFSGGMRQRIVIAIALSSNPDVLICDEPTTALDVTIQSQILELINKVKKERALSVIFITHDLGVVANIADRVAVMYAGKIVEIGTADDIFYSPAHPYTWALLSSMPDLDTKEKLEAIPGTPPNMIYPPKGDAFAERNKYALKIDFEEPPPTFRISETHYAATWLLHPSAPKVEIPKAITERIARMKAQTGGKRG